MLIIYGVLCIFFSFPFFWLALALHSFMWVWTGIAFMGAGNLWFFRSRFSRVIRHYHAKRVVLDSRLPIALAWERVKARHAHGVLLDLWVYPNPHESCFLWVNSSKNGSCMMSQGMASLIKEDQLNRLYLELSKADFRKTKVENSLFALTLWLKKMKGQPRQFRYWFLSFWFYPFERMLKIAK